MRPICHINLSRGYRGGERQTELLIRWLAGQGLRQRLIARAGQPLIERLADVASLERIAVRKPFVRYVRRCRGAIVHAHEAHAAKLALAARLLAGAPYLVTRRIGKRPGNNPLTRTVYRRADALVAMARSVADGLGGYTGRRDIVVVPSAISDLRADPERVNAIRRRWPGCFLIVNAAALVDAQKGQSHLINVAHRLRLECAAVQVLLLGEGRDRAVFEAATRDLANVALLGFVDNVGDYLAAADAFVLPSRFEGIGGACLDAMAFGLPVIASAVDGLPEIIRDGENGLLVNPGDEDGLFDAICRLHDDRALAANLGAAGRHTAADFTAEAMGRRYHALYKEIDSRGLGCAY